ncbi:hypothetical protein GCM10007036_10740 [Alsobacter metallidurans]|uniref:histidine kinase n=1 Tax=Alsobacter metallidurans TaxID=340221 RepID=A0A917I4Z2_9HYPH|nr:DUF4118 domain-containing protein [Alsobacter metallidurans]GGH12688.1 hypothetical protein GCM10007036_10740 [Alsobacter metallidurans]
MILGGQAGGTEGAGRYGEAALATAAALAIALLIQPLVGLENVDLVFLTAVVAVAARSGPGPAFVACAGAVAFYNFFFLPPLYTFTIADPKHVAALALFGAVALITANLAALATARSLQARRRAETTEALYAFSSRLARLMDAGEVVRATADTVGALLHGEATVLLADAQGGFGTAPPSIGHRAFEAFELDALRTEWLGPERPRDRLLRLGDACFAPMLTGAGLLGAVGAARDPAGPDFAPEEERLLRALADQAAVALERIRLARERDAAQHAAEAERLRSALLNSLSHDLKTPLASILGAVTTLRDDAPLYDAAQREELAATIQEEAERMSRFVTNLLDMARLEAGAVAPRREPTDIGEIVGAALRKTASLTRDHVVTTAIPPLPMLDLDPVLLEQILGNLIENAAKFSPPASAIRIESGQAADGAVTITVRDSGPGVRPPDRERVFDLFFQVRDGDRRPAGSGVGLAICRGFAAALGGGLAVGDNPDGVGAAFALTFPPSLLIAAPEAVA